MVYCTIVTYSPSKDTRVDVVYCTIVTYSPSKDTRVDVVYCTIVTYSPSKDTRVDVVYCAMVQYQLHSLQPVDGSLVRVILMTQVSNHLDETALE